MSGFLLRKKILRKAHKKQREVITLKLVEKGKQVGKVIDFDFDEKTGEIKTLVREKICFRRFSESQSQK